MINNKMGLNHYDPTPNRGLEISITQQPLKWKQALPNIGTND